MGQLVGRLGGDGGADHAKGRGGRGKRMSLTALDARLRGPSVDLGVERRQREESELHHTFLG